MVEEIYKMKNDILKQIEKEVGERGIERIDVNRIGEMVDMVKDLAEAEKSCWEASYYRQVSEAMEGSSGYRQSGYQQSGSMRSGYGAGTGSSAGYGAQDNMRQGYPGMSGHTNIKDELREALQHSTPDERERLRNEVLSMIGAL